MNVCIFTENYYKGGLDTFLTTLLNNWPKMGDDLFLCCNASHPGLKTIETNVQKRVCITPYFRFYTSAFAHGQALSNISRWYLVRAFYVLTERILRYPVLFPWYTISLLIYFRKKKFDRLLVVNGGYPASLLCRSATIAWALYGKKPKAIFNFHNSLEKTPWYFIPQEKIVDIALVRSCSSIISVSKNCLFSLYDRSTFLDCGKLSLIYNGISDPLTSKAELDRSLIAKMGRYCLMLATYEERKGHAFLFEAFQNVFSEFPDVRLLICGDGKLKERKRVEYLVKYYQIESNVVLSDFVPNVAGIIQHAEMLVVPSQAFESFGLTIIEAMAMSTPVVATDVGGIPEVLSNSGAGFVVPRNDSYSFAKSVKKILSDPILARQLGRNGRKTYEERYTAVSMAEKYRSALLNSH